TAALAHGVVLAHEDRDAARLQAARAVARLIAELAQPLVGEAALRAARLLQTHHVGPIACQQLRQARPARPDSVEIPTHHLHSLAHRSAPAPKTPAYKTSPYTTG